MHDPPAPPTERGVPAFGPPGHAERRFPEPESGGVPAGWVPDFSPDPDEPPRTELWSAVGDVPPWGTVLLLLACGLVFALQAVRGEVGDTFALITWGASLRGTFDAEAAWRLTASTFLHSGGYHLMLNALSLLMFGVAVEAIFARPSFWTIWVVGGAAASAASFATRSASATGAGLSVGASGAIFALAGALLVSAVRLRGRLAPGRARALAAAMLFLVGQSLAGSIVKPSTDHVAHGAGLLAGALVGLVVPLNARLAAPGEAAARRGAGPWALLAGITCGLLLAAAFALALARGLATP